MKNLLRQLFGRRPRSLPVVACLVAVSLQVVLPLLHASHGVHAPGIAALDPSAGSLRSEAPHGDPAAAHEPTSCPQCRLASQLGHAAHTQHATFAPALRTESLAVLGAEDLPAQWTGPACPARGPPFLA